jgi:hypothetical protein
MNCPYCTDSFCCQYFFKHIFNTHQAQLFDDTPIGKSNKASLKFGLERSVLPRVCWREKDKYVSKYVCWSCQVVINRESLCKGHLKCLKASKQVADELLDKMTPSNTETPPLPSQMDDMERIAYLRVIDDMLTIINDLRYWKAKYDIAVEREPDLANAVRDAPEPEDGWMYDVVEENSREAKIVKLDSATIEKASKVKLR